MRHQTTEGRDREVENEPAVRGPAAQDADASRDETPNPRDNDATTTRRGSSSGRSERKRPR